MGNQLDGSRTIFRTPTPEFIDYALQLPEKILELNPREPVDILGPIEIVDTQRGGEAFVKGIFLKEIPSFYSYNFNDANVNPDRDDFNKYDAKFELGKALSDLRDIDIMKDLLTKIITYYNQNKEKVDRKEWSYGTSDIPFEMWAAYQIENRFDERYNEKAEEFQALWKKAFEEVCENLGITSKDGKTKKIALMTDYKIPENLKSILDDYTLVSLPGDWTRMLSRAGVQTDKDIVPEYIEECLPTSLSLDYGSQIWSEQRIVLDACQNHLPTDSKGSNIFLRFQTFDGKWHDYREFDKYEDWEILKIKISDDGIGYDSKNLSLFASVKDSESSGKWGEGLKMLAAAAVREGIQLELRSRDWIATPEIQTETLNTGKANEKDVKRLVFRVKTKVNSDSKILNDGDWARESDYGFLKENEVSSTTFVEPTPELIREFRNIRESVLAFNPRTPIATTNEGDILDTTGGKLFVRGILIPGNHRLKYSYHLKDFDIETRDRDVIKNDSMKAKIRSILENIEDEKFISEFLSNAVAYAQEYNREDFLEFNTRFSILSNTPAADRWIRIFKHKFGDRMSIRGMTDMDFNALHQARHMGLDMITLPDSIADALINLKGTDGQTIISYDEALKNAIENVIPVPEEELTEHERDMVEHLIKYNKLLELTGQGSKPIKKIKIFDYPEGYKGEQAAGFASLGDVINISRRSLNSGLIEAGHVFFHETGHAITGAQDADKAFRDYLSRLLSCIAAQALPLQQSVEDNGVAEGISKSDIDKFLENLRKQMLSDKGNIDKNTDGEEVGD